MNTTLSIVPNGSGLLATSVAQNQIETAKETLAAFGSRSRSIGIRDCEVLEALVSKRDQLDPFKVQIMIVATMNRYLGPWISLLVQTSSFVLLFVVLLKKSVQIGSYLKQFESYLPWLGAAGGVGALGAMAFSDEEKDVDWEKVGTAALEGLVLGMLPAPFAAVVNAMKSAALQLLGFGGSSTGGANSSVPTVISAPLSVAGNVASAAAPGAFGIPGLAWMGIKKLLGLDEEYDAEEVTDDELVAVADVFGTTADEVAAANGV